MKTIIKNLEELDVFTKKVFEKIQKKDSAIIFALSGDLGAGKTALVKSAAKYFAISDNVTSPTFVIQKEYEIKNHDFFKKMIHIDAYRLESAAELEYLKWNEIILDNRNIIFIEWPEQVAGIDMPNVAKIHIEILDDEIRKITVS
ncbi:MAG: tRNA (adenosine(37)-N6)-threonylcarbamoyltransferase complex ATPase subunit type 1 TsaE [Candidatus Pacebacteria bacterium]|nr:tRNA (adenosine(37)-N6)-threonylcarbamoyltransferase complex ATPase subunit type 1 TsaE [Candidatus Paceibacterota bacterium]